MKASLTIDTKGLQLIAESFKDPVIEAELRQLPQKKAIAALVGQAIADNFDQQGPGWKPLSSGTIQSSVGKKKMAEKKGEPHRMILQKTGLLKMAATIPGAHGNVWKADGTKLIWGVNLAYAGIHNYGGVIKHPGSNNGFGRGINIKPHNIKIPKREFLTIREHWMQQITEYVVEQAFKVIWGRLGKVAK